MVLSKFSERLREALSQTARDIPEQTNLFPNIQQQLRSEQLQPLPRPDAPGQKKIRLAIAVVVMVLLISGFSYAVSPVFQWFGDQSLQAITLDHATAINQQVSDHGITLRLDQAYADGARTAVTFHITSGSSLQASPNDRVLTDAAGHIYPLLSGRQYKNEGLTEFLPLSLQQLGKSQLLTFHVQHMWLTGYKTHGTLISGNWSISFHITPQAGRLITLTGVPSTRSSITIQPTQLELAPSGLRLFLHISGLTSDTSLSTLTQFATRQVYSGTTPDKLDTGTGSIGEGALLQIHLANGQVLEPVRVDVPSLTSTLQIPDQMVGITGAATLEVLFFSAPQELQHNLTLTIDHMHIAPMGDSAHPREANGPWTFNIPLQ